MKKCLTIFIILLFGVNFSFAQDELQKPTVSKAVYFDVSPPLRDMVQQSDASIDKSWKEGIVKNKLNSISNDNSIEDSQVADPIRQISFGDAITDTTIQNFDGVGPNGSYPPDTDGEVSLNHYMHVVNTRFAVYDKNGNKLLGPSNNSVIFNGLPNNTNDGDAVLLYDENADRWLFSQFALPNYPNGPFYENVAISQTNDPTGSWYRYQFSFTEMPDYPKLSVWGDGYYMTIRRFSAGSLNWVGPAAVAMDRDKMLVGDPTAGMIKYNLPASSEGPLSADCDSQFPPAGTPCPVCYLSASTVKIYDFHVDWATPANSSFISNFTLPITPFATMGSGNVITQKNTSQKLDGFSRKGIMFRMPYRTFNGYSSMLLNTTVNVSSVAGIRWMELRYTSGAWSLYQEGTYAPGDGHHRWMGSIAMDSIGNIALGYSISSTNMFPSIRYTGRMAGDPLGVMTIAEKGIINGGGSQTNSDGRWGDYSAMVADPSVVGKFWYTQEYYASTSNASWKTRIASFSFSNIFSTVASAVPQLICQGDSSQLNVSPNGGSGTYSYTWSSIPAGFNSTLQSPKVAPEDTTKFVVTTSDGLITRNDTVSVNVMTMPVVSAGADTIVCWYVTSVDVAGTASNYKALGWTTTGSGTFANASALSTTYQPTLADKLAGSVDLKLVAIANLPCTGNIFSVKKVTFDACTGIAGDKIETGLTIRPNPAHGSVVITLNGIGNIPAQLTITSVDGKMIFNETIVTATTNIQKQLDITGYASGIYVVQLKTGKQVITEKMIVQ